MVNLINSIFAAVNICDSNKIDQKGLFSPLCAHRFLLERHRIKVAPPLLASILFSIRILYFCFQNYSLIFTNNFLILSYIANPFHSLFRIYSLVLSLPYQISFSLSRIIPIFYHYPSSCYLRCFSSFRTNIFDSRGVFIFLLFVSYFSLPLHLPPPLVIFLSLPLPIFFYFIYYNIFLVIFVSYFSSLYLLVSCFSLILARLFFTVFLYYLSTSVYSPLCFPLPPLFSILHPVPLSQSPPVLNFPFFITQPLCIDAPQRFNVAIRFLRTRASRSIKILLLRRIHVRVRALRVFKKIHIDIQLRNNSTKQNRITLFKKREN